MIYIVDTTLRDGEQTPGVVFHTREKVHIARLLDRLGVYQIEAGVPAMGECEIEAISAIASLGLRSRVNTWNRLFLGDIRASIQCGIKDLHISAPVSDIQLKYKLRRSKVWVLDCLRRAIRYAFDYGCRVTVGMEDASRADPFFLLELALLAQEMGAERLRYCDTVGILDPISTYKRLSDLHEILTVELEFHGHNDFGMATANTLSAIEAGICYVDTTIGGLGERAGNTCLEELYMALKGSSDIDLNLKDEVFPALCRYVGRASNNISYKPGCIMGKAKNKECHEVWN